MQPSVLRAMGGAITRTTVLRSKGSRDNTGRAVYIRDLRAVFSKTEPVKRGSCPLFPLTL